MHRIINTRYGEVMLKQYFETDNKTGIDLYIGDNYDQFIGEFDYIDLNSSDEVLEDYACKCIESENSKYFQ